MAEFQVFISHQNNPRDDKIVESIERMLKCADITPYVAEKDHPLGKLVWEEKIKPNLDISDVFFAIWTDFSKDSHWVQKEIEYAYKHKQVRFLAVQKGLTIPSPYDKVQCIIFDFSSPEKILFSVVDYLKKLKRKKESDEFRNNVAVVGSIIVAGLMAGIAAWLLSKKKQY